MRKFIIFALLLAAGLFFLWRYDQREQQARRANDPSVEDVQPATPVAPESDVQPEPAQSAPGRAGETVPVAAGNTGETPAEVSTPAEAASVQGGVAIIRGHAAFNKYDDATGAKVLTFATENAQHVGDPKDYVYRFENVTVELFDPQTGARTGLLKARSAQGTIEVGGIGSFSGLAEEGLLAMEGVEVHVEEGHPLAPFTLTGEHMTGQLDLGRFQSSGDQPVQLNGQGIEARGWNIDLDSNAGHALFLGGGQFTLTAENGETASFVTERGSPLRIVRVGQEPDTRIQALVDGGGSFRTTGATPWELDARGLSLEATRGVDGKYEIDRVETTGAIEARHEGHVFRGMGARLVRLPEIEGLDLEIRQSPRAEIRFPVDGTEREVELSGDGPLTVHAERMVGASEQGDIELKGAGEAHFPGEQPSTVSFDQGLSVWVDRLNRSGTFRAKGQVRMVQGDAWLRTEVLDSIVWSADQGLIDVACEGNTTARLVDRNGQQLAFTATRGAMVQISGDQWRVPQASGVMTSQVGEAPVEIRADELRDLDWQARTFRAWGSVGVQNQLGIVQCATVHSPGDGTLSLAGTPESPALLELLLGTAVSKDLLSGNLSAQTIEMSDRRIDCRGNVNSTIALLQGEFRQKSNELRLAAEERQPGEWTYEYFASGNSDVRWLVGGEEVMHTVCSSFEWNGQVSGNAFGPQNAPQQESANPYSIVVHSVQSMTWRSAVDRFDLTAGSLQTDGIVWIGGANPRVEPQGFRADGGITVSGDGGIRIEASARSLVVENNPRSVTLEPFEGDRIVATGILPGLGLPYRLQCTHLSLGEDRLEATEPEFRSEATGGLVLFPSQTDVPQTPAPSLVRAGSMVVTAQGMEFKGGVFASGSDSTGVPVSVTCQDLTLRGNLRRVVEGKGDLATIERVEAGGGFQVVYGGLARAKGREMVVLPTFLLLKGDSQMRVRVELADLLVETERMEVDLDDFLIKTTRGVMRGGEGPGAWTVDYASLSPVKRDGDTMFAVASPKFSEGNRTASANWAMLWIKPEAWAQRGRAALWGEPLPEDREWEPGPAPGGYRPDAIEQLLNSLKRQELPHYMRAALLEGNVEATTAGRRLARADSLYLDVDSVRAWLNNAEISRLLRMGGKDHKLRIKTDELKFDPNGTLSADAATITTCDHDEPHFVVQTGELRLIPRADQRWRFSAVHNRINFHRGWGLPMPSIRNVILDEEGGFEGFENEQGEVTTVDNIVLQNTPRFGTSLGTNLAYDIDKVGRFVARLFQFDSDLVRGRWKFNGSWLSSRGPLLGIGLQLRESQDTRQDDEDFWLDIFARGIPDDGEDRGILRVPKDETDAVRTWFAVRGRYPFDEHEWLDVVFNTQTDPGVQAEFFQDEYQRYEERDSYLHWRKARSGHYFSAMLKWQQDSFRTVTERLPAVGAFRGLQELVKLGPLSLNYQASADVENLRRKQGDLRYEDAYLDAAGNVDNLGERNIVRADTEHLLEMPLPLGLPGSRLTPFASARFTAWEEGLVPDETPNRLVARAGARWQGLFTQTSGSSYHTLIPRASFASNVALEQDGGDVPWYDGVEAPQDGDFREFGLRSLWSRPDLKRWLDFDVAVLSRTNRENNLPETEQLRFLGGFRTEFNGMPVGIEHDHRRDLENDQTLYSNSILAIKPTEDLIMQFGHQRGLDGAQLPLFETASLALRYRLNPKWEIQGTNYISILDNGSSNLQSNFTLRRFAHDFVLEVEISRYAGEGGTGFGINLVPMLAWKVRRLGILDR
ncbi:MAG: hypothetical protein R3F17_04855 [Planctomycetota bacterium]